MLLWLRALDDHVTAHGAVILTLRADHLPTLAVDPDFARLAERGLYLVSPLTGEQLRRVIEEPARVAGLRLEHGLVDLMMRDAEDQPGALPLMSHALTETWRRREGSLLTVDGYRDSGGIASAVAASADRVYDDLSTQQRVQLRWLMLRMAGLADAGEPIRTPVERDVALADPDRARVLDLLVRTRLVTSDRGSFEIAHESLVRAWPRLRTWLEEDQVAQRVWRHLATAASEWERLEWPDTELYAGVRLDAALEWAARPESMPTQLESEFLQASESRAVNEQVSLVTQAHHERRQNRRLRAILAGAVVLLVVATAAGALAAVQQRVAGRERDVARSAETSALHESLVGRSITARSTNRAVAALLAVEAYHARADDLSEQALFGSFTDAPGFLGYRSTGRPVVQGDVVPGTNKAVLTTGTHLQVVDLETGDLGPEFEQPGRSSETQAVVQVSADGSRVALLVFDPDQQYRCDSLPAEFDDNGRDCTLLSVYDVGTGALVFGPVPTPFSGWDVAIDGDGSLVAVSGGLKGDLATYDVRSGQLIGTLPGLPRPYRTWNWRDTGSVVFDDRGHVYLGSLRGPVREVDARSLEVQRRLPAPRKSTHNHVALTGAGQLVAAGDEGLVSFDLETGRTLWHVDLSDDADPNPCPSFAVAEQIGRFYCGTSNGEVAERSLATGLLTSRRLDPQLGEVGDLAVSQGNELVVFSRGYYRWRLDGSGPVSRLVAPGQAALAGYDTTGRYLPVAERDALDHGSVLDLSDGSTAVDLPDRSWPYWLGGSTLLVYGTPATDTELYDVAAGTHWPPADSTIVDNSLGVYTTGRADGRAWLSFRDTSDTGWSLYEIDTSTGARTGRRVTSPADPVYAAPDRDGRSLWIVHFTDVAGHQLSSDVDGQVAMSRVDIASDQVVATMDHIANGAVSRSGRLVGATLAGDIAEYDGDSLEPVASLAGSRAMTEQLAFSDDGERLLVTADDGTVQVYDSDDWVRLGVIPSDAPENVAEGWLRPDGRAVAVNGDFGVVEWTLDPKLLAVAACDVAGRNMTHTEWATYMPDQPYRRTCPDYPAGT